MLVAAGLFAALTVASAPETGCPDEAAIVARLRALGVTSTNAFDVRVRFSMNAGKRVAEIQGSAHDVRRIEHAASDCASLADATVALLSVLLDEIAESTARSPRAGAPAPMPPSASPDEPPARPPLRLDAGLVGSNGIVADVAAGVTVGAAWRPGRVADVGVEAELWPAREHALAGGSVSLSAWTVGAIGCAGPSWDRVALAGCLGAHGGLYSLSGAGFPVVRPADRGIFGLDVAGRLSFVVVGPVGLFARAGLWIPMTRFDVTVRGAASGFATTSIGPKVAIGLEISP